MYVIYDHSRSIMTSEQKRLCCKNCEIDEIIKSSFKGDMIDEITDRIKHIFGRNVRIIIFSKKIYTYICINARLRDYTDIFDDILDDILDDIKVHYRWIEVPNEYLSKFTTFNFNLKTYKYLDDKNRKLISTFLLAVHRCGMPNPQMMEDILSKLIIKAGISNQ